MDPQTAQFLEFKKIISFYVQVVGMSGVRWYGVFFIFPIFIWARIPPLVISMWAFILALPAVPGMVSILLETNLTIWPITSPSAELGLSTLEKKQMTIIGMKEFMLGVVLGLFPAAFFYGFTIIGEILDQARGDLGARSGDGGDISMTSCATILFLAGASLFVASGEFIKFIYLIYQSYEIWPVYDLSGFLSLTKVYYFLTLSMGLLYQSLMMGFPFLIVMWSFDIMSLFQAKLDKKFQAQDYAPALKNFIFLIFFIFYLKITDLEQYNPTLSIADNFSVVLEAGNQDGRR